ncbi:MAG: hypothetical protein WA813_00385, partial [Beijerinckiaceae bacterium]
DDDLVVIRDPAAIAAFAESLEAMWRRGGNMSEAVDASRFWWPGVWVDADHMPPLRKPLWLRSAQAL